MRSLLMLFLTLCFSVSLVAQDSAIRHELEQTYRTWRDSMIQKDFATWQTATASYRQMMTRNLIVSQNQQFPKAVFDIPMMPPSIQNLRLIKATQVGDTAALVYFGKVDIGVAEVASIPENVLVVRFLREQGRWKFNTTRLVNLESVPHIRAELQQRGSSAHLAGADFEADGVVEPYPKACPKPERMGLLRVAALGYKVRASVNGFTAATVSNNAEEHLIIGGLKRGSNPLELQIEALDLPEGARRSLVVHAMVTTQDPKRPVIKVFTYAPEQLPSTGTAKADIVVSPMTLR